MKILLFGKNGQVGWELNRSLQSQGEVIALGRESADFSKPESLRKIVQDIKPDVIVNAVAYTAVDRAEEEEGLVTEINAIAPGVLAEEALKINALLVYYSTDYVFDGTKKDPYIETDKPNPINAYGRTKLAGEQATRSSGCDYLIFRTSWVYASRGHNFLLTMLKIAQEREELKIVSDQIGAPTSARLIAETTVNCLQQAMKKRRVGDFTSDLYHLTASGQTSWHGFAEKILLDADRTFNIDLKVKQIKAIMTVDYPTRAQRPMNSRLKVDKLQKDYAVVMPDWADVLQSRLNEFVGEQGMSHD